MMLAGTPETSTSSLIVGGRLSVRTKSSKTSMVQDRIASREVTVPSGRVKGTSELTVTLSLSDHDVHRQVETIRFGSRTNFRPLRQALA